MSVYVTRGIGKIINNNDISLSPDESTKWNNIDIAKLLWDQIKPCVQIIHQLQSLEKDFQTFLTGINQLFSAKESPVYCFDAFSLDNS